MKRLVFCFLAAVLMLGLTTAAFAHSGPQEGDEPEEHVIDFTSLDTATYVENELEENPTDARKGWWFVTLRNYSGAEWAGVTINAGAGDLVAIVEGEDLVDEWGFTADSVQVSRPGTIQYIGSLGTGSRMYENGIGLLWNQVQYTFTTPIAIGQSVGFRVYTDNSWYTQPYADSYSLEITPEAVPEPGSVLALSSGLIGMAGLALRRRR